MVSISSARAAAWAEHNLDGFVSFARGSALTRNFARCVLVEAGFPGVEYNHFRLTRELEGLSAPKNELCASVLVSWDSRLSSISCISSA
jgi:hypothetical protein